MDRTRQWWVHFVTSLPLHRTPAISNVVTPIHAMWCHVIPICYKLQQTGLQRLVHAVWWECDAEWWPVLPIACSLVTKMLLRIEQGSRLSTQNICFSRWVSLSFVRQYGCHTQELWSPCPLQSLHMCNEHSDFLEQKLSATVTDLYRDDLLFRYLAL